MSESNNLHDVIDGGYCIGCGACKAVDPTVSIGFDEYGRYQAAASEAGAKVLNVCPFSNEGMDEDAISQGFYGSDCRHDFRFGYYQSLFAGHVCEGQYRELGASGGVITWLLATMLKEGLVDHVLHVKQASHPQDGCLFKYMVSSTVEEVASGAKSRYYPIEISGIMEHVRQHPGRYVFVGIPCFVKAVRRLMAAELVFAERIEFCVGLVCGHLKSAAFADSFAWQAGIAPGGLEEIDFRVKLPGRSAGDYGVRLKGAGQECTRPVRSFAGANWGHNFFRYGACDYCDDVFAETADVAIGDAWLPKYQQDDGGNSVVIVRNGVLGKLIENAIGSGRIALSPLSPDDMALSQAGGLRDRREGLGYRLYLKQKQNVWVPRKRIPAQKSEIPLKRRLIYKNRSKMGAASHRYWKTAVDKGSFGIFSRKMNSMIFLDLVLYKGLMPTLLSVFHKLTKKFMSR